MTIPAGYIPILLIIEGSISIEKKKNCVCIEAKLRTDVGIGLSLIHIFSGGGIKNRRAGMAPEKTRINTFRRRQASRWLHSPGLLPGGRRFPVSGYSPVSYTHLDVYKRQELLRQLTTTRPMGP